MWETEDGHLSPTCKISHRVFSLYLLFRHEGYIASQDWFVLGKALNGGMGA